MLKKLFWNETYGRLTLLRRLFIHLMVFVLVFFPVRQLNRLVRVPLLAALLRMDQAGASALLEDEAYRAGSTVFNSLSAVSELLVLFIALLIIARFVDRRRYSDFFGRIDGLWWADLGVGLLIGGLLQLAVTGVAWLAGWVKPAVFFEAGTDGTPFLLAFLSMLVFFVCAAVNEELQFRGYPIRTLAEGFSGLGETGALLLSVLLTSLVFGLAHATNPHIDAVIRAGIVLGGVWMALGYILSGSLALPIGMHFAWNFVQFFFGFPVSGMDFGGGVVVLEQSVTNRWIGGPFGPESGLLSLAAMFIGMLVVMLYTRRRYGSNIRRKLLSPSQRD